MNKSRRNAGNFPYFLWCCIKGTRAHSPIFWTINLQMEITFVTQLSQTTRIFHIGDFFKKEQIVFVLEEGHS